MSDIYTQSAINEVRDQLSIDFADGKYLNQAAANLGMIRPAFGFTDDMWRALTKAIALQQKQVKVKFEDALTILFGPKHTVATALSEDAVSGDVFLTLVSTEGLPQLGTLVLDRGLPTEESVDYNFIDRSSSKVHLDAALSNSHVAIDYGETVLKVPLTTGDTAAYVFSSGLYSGTSSIPVLFQDYLGTDTYALLTGASTADESVNLSAAAANDVPGPTPEHVHDSLIKDYIYPSEFLQLNSSDKFSDHGYALVGESELFTATGGAAASVDVAAATFTADKMVGYLVQFTGSVTFALLGIRAAVIANTDNQLSFSSLPATPAAGDTFTVFPIVEYDKNTNLDNTLRLKKPIYDLTLDATSHIYVEELGKLTTVQVAQVQSVGTNWDVIQSNPRLVELLLPTNLQDANTVRSASYIHPSFVSPPVTTSLGANTLVGDTSFTVGTATGLPSAGQILVDAAGTPEYIGYKKSIITLDYVSAGSTVDTINVSGTIEVTLPGSYVYIEDHTQGISISRLVTLTGGSSLTFNGDPIPNVLFSKLNDSTTHIWYYSTTTINTAHSDGFSLPHSAADTVEYYDVAVSSTLQSGDPWPIPTHKFPGPYIYDTTKHSVEGASVSTTLSDMYSGPTELVLGTVAGGNALEVKDATAFPLSTTFTLSVGRGTTEVATTTASSVHLKQRVVDSVQVGSIIGDTVLDLVSLGTAAIDGGDIPSAINFRMIVDRGGANEEVVFVRSVDVTFAKLTVDPMTVAHSPGELVELLADVVVVSELSRHHDGRADYSQRVSRWPVNDWESSPPIIVPVYGSLTIGSSAGFSSTGGTAELNYGGRVPIKDSLSSASLVGDTLLVLNDSSSFPVVYPYEIIIDEGGFLEERAIVSLNNGLGLVTINGGIGGLKNAHSAGTKVSLISSESESLEFTSTGATSFSFSDGVMLNSTHIPTETVVRSSNPTVLRDQGYDFPLRMPSDLLTRLTYVIDLIRAAGIQVTLIESR